jgi:acetylornithine deacetylase
MAPLGVNAIAIAGRLIAELAVIEQEFMRGPRDERFTPDYVTLQVTTIAGGTVANIVPSHCHFGFDVRALPGFDVSAVERRLVAFADRALLPGMRAVAAEADIAVRLTNFVPPFAAAATSPVVPLALRLAGENRTYAVSYATEAGLFQKAGPGSVVCGPGDIAQAHTADEWIAESELHRCMVFLERLADWAEGSL